jgi:hypothetical protein
MRSYTTVVSSALCSPKKTGAGEGIRTLDPNLGKVGTTVCR